MQQSEAPARWNCYDKRGRGKLISSLSSGIVVCCAARQLVSTRLPSRSFLPAISQPILQRLQRVRCALRALMMPISLSYPFTVPPWARHRDSRGYFCIQCIQLYISLHTCNSYHIGWGYGLGRALTDATATTSGHTAATRYAQAKSFFAM